MKKLFLFLFLATAVCPLAATFAADTAAPMSKDRCLACHGPFSDLVGRNVLTESESGEPVNPHVFLPHGNPKGEITECTDCHQQHALPPPKGHKDAYALLDPCYACHHNHELKKCSSCHEK